MTTGRINQIAILGGRSRGDRRPDPLRCRGALFNGAAHGGRGRVPMRGAPGGPRAPRDRRAGVSDPHPRRPAPSQLPEPGPQARSSRAGAPGGQPRRPSLARWGCAGPARWLPTGGHLGTRQHAGGSLGAPVRHAHSEGGSSPRGTRSQARQVPRHGGDSDLSTESS
jgi:hypothetical protein